MKMLRVGGLLLAAALAAYLPDLARAQSGYPQNGATYTPTMLLPATTISATGTTEAILQNINSVNIRLTGSPSGLVATVEGAVERAPATQTWTALSIRPVGIGAGGSRSSITATGLYAVDTTGFASIRLNVSALSSGSAVLTMSGSAGDRAVLTRPARTAVYTASVAALSPAASATDYITVTGAVGKVITITDVRCTAISTAAATGRVDAVKRSTANSGGTSAAMTAVPLDANDIAAAATALSYTANPTTGTLVGIVGSTHITSVTAATTALTPLPATFSWPFPTGPRLRAATDVFAINGGGASYTSGFAANCTVTWVEE